MIGSAWLHDFSRPRLWLGVWLFGWLLCVVLSLSSPIQFGSGLDNSDKLGHFLAYAALSGWSVLIFAQRHARWAAAASLVLLGVAMELAQQQFTVDRMMDALDALANTLGVVAGQCLAWTPARTWLQRLDARLFG